MLNPNKRCIETGDTLQYGDLNLKLNPNKRCIETIEQYFVYYLFFC